MKTITSVSGGMTSAYVAANHPSDYNLFALVRIEDENCRFKDDALRRMVEDRIQKPFIATAEDDIIISTMFDLEQYLGREITWVSGDTYDELIRKQGGYLPNISRRYCTQYLKIMPMFDWWHKNIGTPIKMQIGFRTNEVERANRMLARCNEDGLLIHHGVVGKSKNGKNKWADVPWQMPSFPLIENGISKQDIISYWEDKPVRFAPYNNCVGCFHRNPVFLRWQFQEHPEKMNWFASMEGKGHWKSIDGKVVPYERIAKMLPQMTLFGTDFTSCDAGYCGM